MEEVKFRAPRELSVIEQEYGILAARLGQLEYQINTLDRDKSLLVDSMRDLNREAFAVKQAKAEEDAKKAAEAAKAAEEVKKEEG